MKKLRLKRWVKVTLMALLLVGVLVINAKVTENAINGCIKDGHSRYYCEKHLG